MNRDNIDFKSGDVRRIFLQMLWPTLMGMISMVVLNLTDGAFVGHGAGSDALAAVNIVAPVFLLTGGIALMFGMGASVVASLHMSHDKQKAANINVTQALIGAEAFSMTLSTLLILFPEASCRLFGSNDQLLPLAMRYLYWIAIFLPFGTLANTGMFLIRLDGNPKTAMWIMTTSAIANMFFDWLLIFPFGMGIEGAAIATGGSYGASGLVTLAFLLTSTQTLKLYRLKITRKSLKLTLRNIGYQMRLGSSAFFGDAAIAFVLIVGNYVFIRQLGEDGVAAFSLACYCFPVVFNVSNAIVVSAQPIISFAHGVNDNKRKHKALMLAIRSALLVGIGGFLLMSVGAPLIAAIFLPTDCHAYELALEGLPIFGVAFVFIALNLILVGYMQSTEQARMADAITILRGYVFLLICFLALPLLVGVPGAWGAMPMAELLTCIIALLLCRKDLSLKEVLRQFSGNS